MFRKCAPLVHRTIRQSSFWHPRKWSKESAISEAFDRMKHERFQDMERFFERSCRFRPFFALTDLRKFDDRFFNNLENLIIEVDGQKKFKLNFDVAQFLPDEIEVKTNKGKLIVQAIRERKDDKRKSKIEYYREFTVPEGVKLEDLTCKYEEDGNLLVEAPYNSPAVENAKERSIRVKHEK